MSPAKKIVILIARTLIKIIANLSKLFCYGFHFVFPKVRFTLPEQSNAMFNSKKPHPIPHILWQTNFTNRVTLPVYLNYLFNRLMSPTFAYRLMLDPDAAEFVKDTFSTKTYYLYNRLNIGAARADFWRVLVLQKLGGVYMDIDAHLVWPLGWTLKQHQALYLRIKSGEISNYFIASAAGNPQIEKMIDLIERNIEEAKIGNVYELTGPGIFNQILENERYSETYYKETVNQGNFTNEYFQYIDKPQGKWNKEQQKVALVKPKR
jgi:mannosyltransferase OCH1-like enzyme